ncbi:MAG: hypothetical protein ACOY99_05110 [Pseudomonadota bacterium]
MAGNPAFLVRKWHRWLSLIIGIQALLWLVSGLYMVVVDLDYIHGDHLVRNMAVPLSADDAPLLPIAEVRARYPEATQIKLEPWLGNPHYRISSALGNHLIDARTGAPRSPLSEADAIAVARYHYAGQGDIISARLLSVEQERPSEIQARPLPLWQIRFDDFGATTFYVAPDQGQLVTRRHRFWRIFDFLWMFHIMDYEERADVNNNLLRVAATLGTLMAAFGLGLVFFSFRNGRTRPSGSAGRPS